MSMIDEFSMNKQEKEKIGQNFQFQIHNFIKNSCQKQATMLIVALIYAILSTVLVYFTIEQGQ